MFKCELNSSHANRSYAKIGVDGSDCFSLDIVDGTWSWVADDASAKPIISVLKEKFSFVLHDFNFFLTQHCFQLLRAYLQNECFAEKKKALPPVAKILEKKTSTTVTYVSCIATGFYPHHIDLRWVRNGKDIMENVQTYILPNWDDTYQIKKRSETNSADENLYSCEIQHSSLDKVMIISHSKYIKKLMFSKET
ncbi:major histocompatibility complex class I-related gene protein-like [Protopterus annectens]|uniref:major histocompatibility complex class I-related gene protein-like n=1 Tax=Protopterus annectens TaxID=7888 RepID=UPI001CFB5786|nr:major histocompatibility complex class I-related gene protein-like [Protopterus annectens]